MEYYICESCNGTGKVQVKGMSSDGSTTVMTCYDCNGEGKLNWIENVLGKSDDDPYKMIVMPVIREWYPKLIAQDLVSVQPMTDIFKDDK